jgi:hypothetical protein
MTSCQCGERDLPDWADEMLIAGEGLHSPKVCDRQHHAVCFQTAAKQRDDYRDALTANRAAINAYTRLGNALVTRILYPTQTRKTVTVEILRAIAAECGIKEDNR